ncbi:MAG: hypothetical protein HFK10_05960, partial [Clostridia bacterium]|nr:hypothetical protein [Clostridia bacterium]
MKKVGTIRGNSRILAAVAAILLLCAALSVAVAVGRAPTAKAEDAGKTFVDLGGIVTDYDAVETAPVAIANASFEDALLPDSYGSATTENWRNIWGASSPDYKTDGNKSLKITYEWTGITTSTFPTTYQDIAVAPYTTYVITFAMLSSRVTDKAFHVAVRNPGEWNNIYDYSINANSIAAQTFVYYRCSVYSGHRTTLRLCFWCQGNEGTTNFGGFYVDDVTVSKVTNDNETMQDFSSMFTLREENLVRNGSFEDGEVDQPALYWTRIGWSETFNGNATEGTKSLKICYSYNNQLHPDETVGSYQDVAVEKNSTYVLTFTAEMDNSARNDLHIGYGATDDALTAPCKDYTLDGQKISIKFTTSQHTVYQCAVNSGGLETVRLYFKMQGQEAAGYRACYVDNVQLRKVESVIDDGILASCGTDNHHIYDGSDHAAAGCGTDGHYNCDGSDHAAADCGTEGHYNCDGEHQLLDCGEHYACEGGEHGLANCGTHYVCDSLDH